MRTRPALWILTLLPLLGACGFGDESALRDDPGAPGAPSDASGGASDVSGDAPPAPEERVDFDLRTPEASEGYLFIPSAALDALIAVNGADLQVSIVDVGLTPTIVRALPEDAGAVVLNEGSSDVTIVRFADAGRASFVTLSLPVARGANRLHLSPDGAWAFAYFDEVAGAGLSRPGGFGSLQDVSAIDLTPGAEAVHNLSVGYRPSALYFTDAGRLLLIACEDGLSVVALASITSDTFLPPIPLTDDIFARPLDRAIIPSPDGQAVAVRDLQHKELLWVELESGARRRLPLPDFPSDLDMSPDGAHLFVPLRAEESLLVIDIPEAFTWAPEEGEEAGDNPFVRAVPTGAPYGSLSISTDGARGLLYTTLPGVSSVGLLDLGAMTVTRQPLSKEIAALAIDPRGVTAAIFHRESSGVGSVAGEHAWSLLDLATGYAKLNLIEHPISAFSFTPDGAELFALLPDPSGTRHAVQRVRTDTFAMRTYALPDPPTFVGALPQASRMAIALDNPTGWITFIDTVTDEVRQLNSFELNAFID